MERNRVRRRQHGTRVAVPRGVVPHGRDYPAGVPARLIPAPTNVYLPDGSGRPCTYSSTTYPARWPTGAAVAPSNRAEVLVSYIEVCVRRANPNGVVRQRVEGWGYLLYNWRAHRIDRGPVDVFRPQRNAAGLADSMMLGSPYFDDHKLTFFAFALQLPAAHVCGRSGVVGLPARTARRHRRPSFVPCEATVDRRVGPVGAGVDLGWKVRRRIASRRDDVGRWDLPDLLRVDLCRAVASERVGNASRLPRLRVRASATPSPGIPS